MAGQKDDERLLRRIELKLTQIGLRSPCEIIVRVSKGVVTLGGTVLFDYQKRAAVRAIRALDDVDDIVDELKIPPADRQWE